MGFEPAQKDKRRQLGPIIFIELLCVMISLRWKLRNLDAAKDVDFLRRQERNAWQ